MNELAPRLPRKPFGYDPVAVDQMLSERDTMLGMAERRVQAAEARMAALQEQLTSREAAVADLTARLAEAAARPVEAPAPPTPEPEPEPLSPRFMTEELSKIVMAAEASTSSILERAWTSTREQIVEADRLWREVQTEVVRFAEWRDQAEAVVNDLQSHLDQARAKIESVPSRIQDALGPAVEAMVAVDEGMSRFAQASTLPLLLTPSGLENARARAEAMGDLLNGDEGDGFDQEPFGAGPPLPDGGFEYDDMDAGAYEAPGQGGAGEADDPMRALSVHEGVQGEHEEVAAEASEELRQVQSPAADGQDESESSSVWGA